MGKSTLMHCMAGLDAVTSGRIWIGDTELSGLADSVYARGLDILRARTQWLDRPPRNRNETGLW